MLFDQYGFHVRRRAGFGREYTIEPATRRGDGLADAIGFHVIYTEEIEPSDVSPAISPSTEPAAKLISRLQAPGEFNAA